MSTETNAPLSALAGRADGPTADQIWAALAPGERQDALTQYLAGDRSGRESLVAVVATLPSLRAFRKVTIAQFTDGKLIELVARAGKLPPGLTHDFLLALHLRGRSPMLESFLDLLGIPHTGGVIADGASIPAAVQANRLATAASTLVERYPRRAVSIYLLTLLAMDPGSWAGLRHVVPDVGE